MTTIDRVLSKLRRDLRNTQLNEGDVIEWIGDALEQLKVEAVQEEALAFFEVKNYHAELPENFNMVIQIARDKKWTEQVQLVVK
jgi:hypothetical protein